MVKDRRNRDDHRRATPSDEQILRSSQKATRLDHARDYNVALDGVEKKKGKTDGEEVVQCKGNGFARKLKETSRSHSH